METLRPAGRAIHLADLAAEVVFINPSQLGRFQYGLDIRDSIGIRILSEGFWRVYGWIYRVTEDGGLHRERVPIGAGQLEGLFNTKPKRENHILVTAWGDQGCLYVNEELVACFDISSFPSRGNISVASRHETSITKNSKYGLSCQEAVE